jgi:cysteine desulfurase
MIYADFNATTPLGTEAKQGILRATELWGNPSSAHALGRQAAALLAEARASVARAVGATPEEVVFTSGGSEANTLALWGSCLKEEKDFRIISSRIEHSSIRGTLAFLESRGAKIEYVKVLPTGNIDMAHFAQLLAEFKPQLVSIMAVNNETGVVLPTPEIGKLCRTAGTLFHTDAVQGFGKVGSEHWASADFVSVSAHKIHGPKGIGALVVRKGRQLMPTHFGGAQEIKRRGGTENIIGIAGFGGAARELEKTDWTHIRELRDALEDRLRFALEPVTVQGRSETRVPNTSNLRFPGVSSQVILGALDLDGICVSAGSACSSGSITPSHVLLEMGLSPEEARECVRLSFGKSSTAEELEAVGSRLISHVERIRARHREKAAGVTV